MLYQFVRNPFVAPSVICNKELQKVLKELSISPNFISKLLSTIDFCMLKKSITLRNKKSLQKLLYTHHKK